MAHITYKSQLTKVDIDLSNVDLNSTKIKIDERPEYEVFGGRCPYENPYNHGYRCFSSMLIDLKQTNIEFFTLFLVTRIIIYNNEVCLMIRCTLKKFDRNKKQKLKCT